MRKWEETNKFEDYLEIHEADKILNVKIELVSKPKSYNLLRNIHLNKELKIITKMARLMYNNKNPKDYNLKEKSILGISKESKCKNVHFDEKMTVHGLICPNEIFYCVRPKITDVIFENIPAIRTIKSESGNYFCYCNNCKFMGERCKVSPCPNCYF